MVQNNDIPTYSTLSDSLYHGLKIGCRNIRGLLGKIDELRFLVLECNFDIMGICETFLDDNVADHEIIINGFNVIRRDRHRDGGGVLLYIKEGIFYDQEGLTVLTCPNNESVWVNIKCAKNGLALGIMYRPPSSVNEYFNNMLDQIDNVFSYYEDVVLMGDLNYDYKPVLMHSNKLHQIEVLYGMQQLISSPTRVTLTTSSLIDVILSNDHMNLMF